MDEVQTIKTLTAAGWDDESAREACELIHAAVEQDQPERAWTELAANYLSPADDFSLHTFLYEQCYGENALLRSPGPAWWPSAGEIGHANVTAATRALGLADYPALHRWSVNHRPEFWEYAMRRLEIRFRTPYTRVLDAAEPTRPKWLVNATMNIVDSCLHGDPAAPAIIESDGSGLLRVVTYAELSSLVARVANGLVAYGIKPGDAVAMITPMSALSVATYLGVIAAGAAAVSIPDSFSADEIATRLRISQTKLVATQDFTMWGAKRLPLYEKVKAATQLPIGVIRHIPFAVDPNAMADESGYIDGYRSRIALRPGDLFWEHLASDDVTFTPIARSPQDVVNILFSSGTTGEPKAIPWDHTTPIKCAVDAHFHHDLHAGDVVCWPTNLGWMMGPWLIFASLMNRCAMALYAQAPQERGFGQFVQDAGVTMLGGVPSLVRAWKSTGCMKGLDWSRIRAFSSSGECSNAADQFYLMHLAGYRPVIEYCGGTEIGGAYLTSTVVQPNTPATFTTAALGIDVVIDAERSAGAESKNAATGVADSAGSTNASATYVAALKSNSTTDTGCAPFESYVEALHHPTPARSIVGEAFLVGPSIGLSTRLLNRDHDAVYFEGTPLGADGQRLRRHGDELEALPDGQYRVAGRSDDTMNLGGIKVGCAELERALSSVADVHETAAVAVPPPGGGPSRLIVFAVAKPGTSPVPATLKTAMQQAIRDQLNPLFRLEEVRVVPSLPRTASNKVMRRELRAAALAT